MAKRKYNHREKTFLKILMPFIITLFLITITSGCREKNKYVRCEGMIWNTMYHITYKGDARLQDSILPMLNEVGGSLSVFDHNSLVSQLNKSDSIKGDPHLIKVYDASLRINELSEGNFDPTVSPLIDAWGFGRGHKANPDTLAIDSLMDYIGIHKTHRNGEFIVKENPYVQFNFSAIAKGYGCDAVGEMFKRNGVEDFMVEIGGELRLSGRSPSGSNWQIGIDAPVEDTNPGEEPVMILDVTDVGVATSGNYRNYRIDQGQKRAHTISPKTGRPIIGEILSATVIAATCMEADGLATACMASTTAEATEILKQSGVAGLLIFADSIWTTPSFEQYIKH